MYSIILAAGQGKRLHSKEHALPKAMHEVLGIPLIDRAVELVDFIPKENTYIVVGFMKELIEEHLGDEYKFAVQAEQLGTGHAVMSASEAFKDLEGDVLITYGDMPLYRKETLKGLCKKHMDEKADCTVMSAVCDDLKSYGRIIRDNNGKFAGIVEARDCTPEQYAVNELNSGVMICNIKSLFNTLPLLKTDNDQHEYYLTDVPKTMLEHNMKVELYSINDGDEIRGVNTEEELLYVESVLKNRK